MILIAASFSKEYMENNCKLVTPEITILVIFTFIELLAWLHISNCVLYKVAYSGNLMSPTLYTKHFYSRFLTLILEDFKAVSPMVT